MRIWPLFPLFPLSVVLLAGPTSCQRRAPSSQTPAGAPSIEDKSTSQCDALIKSPSKRPLVVEWPSSERAALEAGSHRGLVVLHYDGCEMELLRECKLEGSYDYIPVSVQQDKVVITDKNSLYASIPAYAVNFEAKLEQEGGLTVDMRLVGIHAADRTEISEVELVGDCETATHVAIELANGAFVFSAGSGLSAGAGVSAGGASVGGETSKSHEVLNRGGDFESCEGSKGSDEAPPHDCGTVVRMVLAEIDPAPSRGSGSDDPGGAPPVAPQPRCPPLTQWDGKSCAPEPTDPDAPEFKDNDLDGVLNGRDLCPNTPEDQDGFEDQDGCPDSDNDGDGVFDMDDRCPNQAEDMDGVQDEDGCPE